MEVVSDITIPYTYEPGLTLSGFLQALGDRRIEGGRCPSCSGVYVPPRSRCPECRTGPLEPVLLPDRGSVVSYTVVHIPFPGLTMELPFVCAWIRLDGADVPFAHLLGEIGPEDVMRGAAGGSGVGCGPRPGPHVGERQVLPPHPCPWAGAGAGRSVTRVAVVGFASEVVSESDGRSDAELLAPVVDRALEASGLSPADIGVIGTAGSEFLNGVVGSVMGAFDALPGWPPRTHSHLDADGAFALYESWVRLMAGRGARRAGLCLQPAPGPRPAQCSHLAAGSLPRAAHPSRCGRPGCAPSPPPHRLRPLPRVRLRDGCQRPPRRPGCR